jgi:enoyl-CoA hydratase
VSERHERLDGLRALLAADPPTECVVDFVGHQRSGAVGILTLSRPEQLNALSLGAWRRIREVATATAADSSLRALVIRGAGQRAFSAGADIAEFPSTRMTARDASVYNSAIADALSAVAAVPVPVVAMIDGLAVGGGLELSAVCDVRLASEGSRFGIPIGRLGVTLGLVEASALTRLIGSSELKYLLFSGRLIDTERALRTGLVQVVVRREQLVDELLDLLASVTTSSLPAILAAKAVADASVRPLGVGDADRLSRLTAEIYEGADLAEGVAAFTERRTPDFPSQQAHHFTPEVHR